MDDEVMAPSNMAPTSREVGPGTDIYSKEKRSALMSRVRSQNTKPEKRVRTALHKMGYRFRLHRKDLPGKPDIVLPKHRTVIFVHGCFWHQHADCTKATLPKQNAAFWEAKLGRNTERDREVHNALEALGWRVVTLWECQLRGPADALANRLKDLMNVAGT